MPTYEYNCENCGFHLEKMQSITAKALRKCPKCGKPALKRLIGTGAGIIFKGSGFYATDYRSESYKNAAKAETAPKETTKKDENKIPAKTENKTPVAPKKPRKEKK
jgi:putative FmdB family regulatory protein